MTDYLEKYISRITAGGNSALAEAIKQMADKITPRYISSFSFRDHVVSLLVGDVQSGKTSHMFGLMCAAADNGFGIFVLLTTDNILLQQQTLKRAERDLCDFCVCGENDYLKFLENNLKKPVVIVLKKNGRILRQWKNNFSSSKLVAGNPLFIVDDEADAASLNTQVNQDKQSTVNKCLDQIKHTTSSSIYLQVTGTPQSIILQSRKSGWKPYFIHYFKPGTGYMGGDFFFNDAEMKHIRLTDNEEASELMEDDEFPENGLKTALITHLISAAHIFLTGGNVCNFLIHPSMKTDNHSRFAEKIGNYLNELSHSFDESETISALQQVYRDLKQTKKSLLPFDEIRGFIYEQMSRDLINVLTLNSKESFEENTQYETGNNVIIGGNSLGRGVTFPRLQTIYYCRVAKNPQADTMWQHARMFGYDRDPDLLRVFMPPKLYKLFSDINHTNKSIIAQIENGNNGTDVKIMYPAGLRPTRKNVLDKKTVGVFAGGVNYFPFSPVNNSIKDIDSMLASFSSEDVYPVLLQFMIKVLEHIDSETADWNTSAFIGFLKAFVDRNPIQQGAMIVRRGRDISKGTGTLLSQNDRVLGDSISDKVVLTLYKITGTKGWNGEKIWIPNIKFPGNTVYYSGN